MVIIMERFILEDHTDQDSSEKKFILLDGKKCGHIARNEKDICEITFAVNYESKPGFRFLTVREPSFPTVRMCLKYLNANADEIPRSFSLHFFE